MDKCALELKAILDPEQINALLWVVVAPRIDVFRYFVFGCSTSYDGITVCCVVIAVVHQWI